MNFLNMIEEACQISGNTKADQADIMLSHNEEGGELAREIKIARGLRAGPHGSDGIVGEAIDSILCSLDIIHTELGHLDETYLCTVAQAKIQKWLKKQADRKAARYVTYTPINKS